MFRFKVILDVSFPPKKCDLLIFSRSITLKLWMFHSRNYKMAEMCFKKNSVLEVFLQNQGFNLVPRIKPLYYSVKVQSREGLLGSSGHRALWRRLPALQVGAVLFPELVQEVVLLRRKMCTSAPEI